VVQGESEARRPVRAVHLQRLFQQRVGLADERALAHQVRERELALRPHARQGDTRLNGARLGPQPLAQQGRRALGRRPGRRFVAARAGFAARVQRGACLRRLLRGELLRRRAPCRYRDRGERRQPGPVDVLHGPAPVS
jgi:hypothetical protein